MACPDKITVTGLLRGLRRLVGIAFLIWSVAAGGGLLRWLIFGTGEGWGYDLAQLMLGCLVAGALWFVWRRIAEDDRNHIVLMLTRLGLAIAIGLAGMIYSPAIQQRMQQLPPTGCSGFRC